MCTDNSDIIVTASRNKSISLWNLTKEDKTYGVPRCRLTGHSHFVKDVAGIFSCHFVGHTKDVLSIALSIDNHQIVSTSRDRTTKLWNTLGECKFTISNLEVHQD
ncbi:hypothetical protein CMV_026171 [Castanea mollissima]|uniref:Uncharacterized protein n=1 Tax=Castanea mollissima TaxID=60419 RepID=A0A8J4VFL0_9ROSI|nr:hypothetical protein CMV_026171 [Castanea mollissima]